MAAPFSLKVTGNAVIPHPAERAVINVAVESSGQNKATVSDEVLTTAKHLETLLRQMAPADRSPEAKQASPLAHWSKTGLTATSHIPWVNSPFGIGNTAPEQQPRQYDASITFDIRFKEFKALGGFGEKLSSLSHVEVKSISWILTPATEKSYHSQLRKEAAQDALAKARDYCEVLGCKDLRPVELVEGGVSASNQGSLFGQHVQHQHMQSQAPQGSMGRATAAGAESRDESPLEFRPEEVKMSTHVTIKFHATC